MIFNIADFLNKIETAWINSLSDLATFIINLLPNSPFLNLSVDSSVSEVLGYVNYFIPVAECVVLATAWGVCIGTYYLYQTALRWANAIE